MYKTLEVDIPCGDAGTAKTISWMKKFADEASKDYKFIRIAREIVSHIPPREKLLQSDALFFFVRDNIKFIDDPSVAEMVQTPQITLQDGWGDCDDFVTLLLALNQSIGIDGGFITISRRDEREFCHTFLAVFLDDQIRFYDPTIPSAEPNFYPKNFGRARIWLDEREFYSLSGFFSSIKKIFKKIGRVFEKIYKELKRVERRIRKERDRLFTRINKEFSRWEKKLGVFGKFLVLGTKVGVSVFTGGLFAGVTVGAAFGTGIGAASATGAFWTGQTVNFISNAVTSNKTPWTMTEEEWKILVNLATAIGSTILSFVPGTQALLVSSVLNLVGTGTSIWDLEEKKKQTEEAIKKLEEYQTRLSFEERIQREALAKMNADVMLLEKALQLQKESELKIELFKKNQDEEIDNFWNIVLDEIATQKGNLQIIAVTKNISEDVQEILKSEVSAILPYLHLEHQKQIVSIITETKL